MIERRWFDLTSVLVACVVIGVLGSLLTGCEDVTNTTFEALTGPDPVVSVSVLGQCNAGEPGEIVCEDRSSSIPEGQIKEVLFTIIEPGGNTGATSGVSPGGEFTASGLDPGSYGVRQVVITKDGAEWGPREYNGIMVG